MNCGSRWKSPLQEYLRAHISACKQKAKIAFKNEHTPSWHFFLVFLSPLFFSHMLYHNCSFPSSHVSQSPSLFLPLFKINSSLDSLVGRKKKRADFPRILTQLGLARYNQSGHKPSYRIWMWQPSRSKSVSNTGKRDRHPLTPIVGSPSRTRSYTTISYRQRT